MINDSEEVSQPFTQKYSNSDLLILTAFTLEFVEKIFLLLF